MLGYSRLSARAALAVVLAIPVLAGCVSYQPVAMQNEIASGVGVVRYDGFTLLDAPASTRDVGLMFYPGGLVDPDSYLGALSLIAEKGYPVVVVHMPSDLAAFAPFKGAEFPDLSAVADTWAIGGHSLGGAMAARAVTRGDFSYDGLILIGAFPASNDDLSKRDLPVLSIYGDKDLVATVDEVEGAHGLLPDSTGFVRIEGANHAQFGSYGEQRGDGEAAITRSEQQRVAAEAIIQFLAKV